MKKKETKIFFAFNIKFLRERKKLTQEALAEKLGITRKKLHALEAGHTRSPQLADIVNFSGFFKISIDSLLKIELGKLSELKLRELEAGNDVYINGGNLRVLAISLNKEENENVEYVPLKAKAGYTSHYSDPEFIAALPKFNIPDLPRNATYRVFPITGDSMLPIPDGSDIVGKYIADWRSVKKGTPCIVILKRQDLVFKLVTVQQDSLLLQSLNPEYAPYEVPLEEVLELWAFYSYHSKAFPERGADDLAALAQAVKEMKLEISKLRN